MFRPTLHEWTTDLEQIGAQVSRLRLSRARVRQRTLRSQVRARTGLRHPIAKAGPEAVHRTGVTLTTKKIEYRAIGKWAARLHARENEPGSGVQLAHFVQNLKDAIGQGNAMREPGFHPLAGNHPGGPVEINLVPLRLTRLARTDRREHQELEQEPERHTRGHATHGDDDFRHFAVRNRRVVTRLVLTRAPLRQHAVDGRDPQDCRCDSR